MTTETIRVPFGGTKNAEVQQQVLAAAARPGQKGIRLEIAAGDLMSMESAAQLAKTVRPATWRMPVHAVLMGPDANVTPAAYLVAAAATSAGLASAWQRMGRFALERQSAADQSLFAATLHGLRPRACQHFLQSASRVIQSAEALQLGLVDSVGEGYARQTLQTSGSTDFSPRPLAPHLQAALHVPAAHAPTVQPSRPAVVPFTGLSRDDQAQATKDFAKAHGLGYVEAFKILEEDAKGDPVSRANRYAAEHKCSFSDALKALNLAA